MNHKKKSCKTYEIIYRVFAASSWMGLLNQLGDEDTKHFTRAKPKDLDQTSEEPKMARWRDSDAK